MLYSASRRDARTEELPNTNACLKSIETDRRPAKPLAAQPGYYIGQKRRISDCDDPAITIGPGRIALPVRNRSPGAADYRQQGGPVPRLQVTLHDHVDLPQRQQPVGVAVPTPVGAPDPGRNVPPAGHIVAQHFGAGAGQFGMRQIRAGARPDRSTQRTRKRRRPIGGADPTLAGDGLVDEAHEWLV